MHSRFRRRLLAVVVTASPFALLPHGHSHAQATQVALKDVVVSAARAEQAADAVAATITTLDRDTIDRRLPADEIDLLRDEPDVVIANDPRRHGATRVNIRGIDDNRVVQMVDGVRLGDYRNGGGPTNLSVATPIGPALDFLKRVEILRGPASSLYGSDAIGGVVSWLTLDPVDLLGKDAARAFSFKPSWNGADRGLGATAMAAARGGALEGLLAINHRKAKETDNRGERDITSAARTRPNPQERSTDALLAKLVARPAAGHEIVITAEQRDDDTATRVLRLSSSLPRVTAMSGDDDATRRRLGIEYRHIPASGWYDRLTARLYTQDNDTQTTTVQTRSATSAGCSASTAGASTCRVEQDFFFKQQQIGGGVQLEKSWSGGGEHLLSIGADYARTRTEELRDARVFNLTTGSFSKTLAGETSPLRDFPKGSTRTLGLFAQDEIGLASGTWHLTPGLRYDRVQLNPELDALVLVFGTPPAAKTHAAWSPKFAARWQLAPAASVVGQLARGFRAPNYEEANGTFRNTVQGYGVSANPDLKPETSTSVELGLRLAGATANAQFTVFDNRYKDFIDQITLSCPGNPACIAGVATTFQNANLSRVAIRGAEARAHWQIGHGWRVDGALATARGDNQSAGQPLNSVEPMRLTLGVGHDTASWGADARLRAAKAVTRVDARSVDYLRPSGYGVMDLGAWWTPAKGARLNLAINNLFDRKYLLWADVRHAALTANDPGPDFYSQPGRNLAASLRLDF